MNKTIFFAEIVYATVKRNQYESTGRVLATKESTAAAFCGNKVKRP